MNVTARMVISLYVSMIIPAVVAISIAVLAGHILGHLGIWTSDRPVFGLALFIGIPLGYIVPHRFARWLAEHDPQAHGFEVLPPKQPKTAPHD